MSDPGLYRTKEEVEEWKRRDPISSARELLVRARHATRRRSSRIEDEGQGREIEEAVKFAEESPELADEHLAEFTYKE